MYVVSRSRSGQLGDWRVILRVRGCRRRTISRGVFVLKLCVEYTKLAEICKPDRWKPLFVEFHVDLMRVLLLDSKYESEHPMPPINFKRGVFAGTARKAAAAMVKTYGPDYALEFTRNVLMDPAIDRDALKQKPDENDQEADNDQAAFDRPSWGDISEKRLAELTERYDLDG